MTLYEILGVKTKADKKVIKNAYRDKAREFHPDKGGNKQAFALIAKAYDILSDSDKRNRYDKTGIESGVDIATQKAYGLLQSIFTDILEKIGCEEILSFNVIRQMEKRLDTAFSKIVAEKKTDIKKRKTLEKIIKRIEHKNKHNAFSVIILEEIKKENLGVQRKIEQIETIEIARKMLKDYNYRFDIAVPFQSSVIFNRFSAASPMASSTF